LKFSDFTLKPKNENIWGILGMGGVGV